MMDALKNILSKHAQLNITNVIKGAQSYALQEIVSNTDKNVIFITSDNVRAKQIYDEFRVLSDEQPLLLLEWDIRPFDHMSPSKNIMEDRIAVLASMASENKRVILITTSEASLQKVVTKAELKNYIFTLKTFQSIEEESILSALINIGYKCEASANEPGEFAARDGIVDIVVPGKDYGYRVCLTSNKIESIKNFDPATQMTLARVDTVTVVPSNELIISAKTIKAFSTYLAQNFGFKSSEAFERVQEGVKPNGVEHWSRAFYENVDSIFSYQAESLLVLDSFVENRIKDLRGRIDSDYQSRLKEKNSNFHFPLLPPDESWLTVGEMQKLITENSVVRFQLDNQDLSSQRKLGSSTLLQHDSSKNYNNLDPGFRRDDTIALEVSLAPSFVQQALGAGIYQEMKNFIAEQHSNKKNVIISCFSKGSRDRIIKNLEAHDVALVKAPSMPHRFSPVVHLIVSQFEEGFIAANYALITEKNIYGYKIAQPAIKDDSHFKNLLSESQNFSVNDLVVHKEYGIGKLEGIETVTLSNSQHDCFKIIYADNDKLFLPVENLELISRYGSNDAEVKLDRLGGTAWQTRKARIKEKIEQEAKYLLDIAAARALKQAEIIEAVPGTYTEFCAMFPYVETPDQERAIKEIEEDLRAGKPMDRLICGDVGFGKTEVALRAAFLAIKPGQRQVALICPTTILSLQHFKVFSKRFANFGINIGQVSRLVPAKERARIIKALAEGKIDLVIGTHALLNDAVQFKNITLLIVDEEQHFGVAQKEKLKKLKENVHVLSMSATPIPRTLQMSLAGIKDLSLITTPPVNRLVTKTSVLNFDQAVIREALLKEYFRGGQSFYICPRISDLPEAALKLKELVPQLKIGMANGQMRASDVDKIMTKFYAGQIDVLLATSIIESGLDIPRANTIIVFRADKFGLSQLYQLRGRVGRSNVPAYAYFLLPPNKKLSRVASKRLQILESLDQLGASFIIASHDMDIRGCGNIVGEAQSGHMKEAGVELYQSMLEEAVHELQQQGSGIVPTQKETAQVNLSASVLIPKSYVNDFDLKLNLYRRISEIKEENEVTAFAVEMIDRFGSIPIELENLLSTIKLKILCIKCGVTKLDVGEGGLLLKFSHLADHAKLLRFLHGLKDSVKFRPDDKVFIQKSLKDTFAQIKYAEELLKSMSLA